MAVNPKTGARWPSVSGRSRDALGAALDPVRDTTVVAVALDDVGEGAVEHLMGAQHPFELLPTSIDAEASEAAERSLNEWLHKLGDDWVLLLLGRCAKVIWAKGNLLARGLRVDRIIAVPVEMPA